MTASAHRHHHHHAAQQHYYDEATDPEFEIRRPRGCGRIYQYLIEHKFRTGMSVLGLDVAGLTVLEVCCGSGLMTEALARRGARVTGTDISSQALVRARSGPAATDSARTSASRRRRRCPFAIAASTSSRSTTVCIISRSRSRRSRRWRGWQVGPC